MISTPKSSSLDLRGLFAGQPAFLVCGGPSLLTHDLTCLQQPGILTMGVNNAATVVRPRLWTSVDDPGNFTDAIWRDPGIWKFIPADHFEKRLIIRNAAGNLEPSALQVKEMPAVFGYRRNEQFHAETWLAEKTFNWGNHGKRTDALGNRGSRSVMYVALKLLYYLGVRKVFLVGCDFRMAPAQQNYAFSQERSPSSIRGNNKSYAVLNSRLQALLPYFESVGFEIRNCTPNSGLTVFPYQEYQAAIDEAQVRKPRHQHLNYVAEGAQQPTAPQANSAPATKEVEWRLDFTTVVGVDDVHIEELKLTWPTWRLHRPEILRQPILFICDGDKPLEQWKSRLAFVDHPDKRFVSWTMPDVSQREKMLSGLVYCPAREVTTPWYLKLDTDALAKCAGPWLQKQWFEPDAKGNLPAYVSPPWSTTKQVDWMQTLEQWGDQSPLLTDHPRLNLPVKEDGSGIRHKRIISWCFFGNTAWTKNVVSHLGKRLPVPSQDTFLGYCADRSKSYIVRQGMKSWWDHIGSYRRLRRACNEVVFQATLAAESLKVRKEPRGVILLLTGIRHAVRLAVCLHSLRKHYTGPVTVMSTQPESHELVAKLAAERRLNINQLRITQVERPRHSSFLTKVFMLASTPYETSVYLDADTIVTGSFEELFAAAEQHGLAVTQFSTWVTTGRTMRKRINQWKDVPQTFFAKDEFQKLIQQALENGPAINTGAFAVRAGAPVIQAWWNLVDRGWERHLVDETAIQLLLSKYPHRVLDHRFNYSPKFGPHGRDNRIWHFHGDKHLKPGRARDAWWPLFQECMDLNIGEINSWSPANDKRLRNYLKEFAAVKVH
jgi:hypothetical protein